MEPDEYQEQQDSLNVNEQTWRDGSSGGLSNPMKEEDDPQIKNRVWAAPLTMEKKKRSLILCQQQKNYRNDLGLVLHLSWSDLRSRFGLRLRMGQWL